MNAFISNTIQQGTSIYLLIRRERTRRKALCVVVLRGRVSPDVLSSLPTGEVYARLGPDVCNFTCPPPVTADPAVAARLIGASRARYYKAPIAALAPAGRGARVIETLD